jgi:hypothetical protein
MPGAGSFAPAGEDFLERFNRKAGVKRFLYVAGRIITFISDAVIQVEQETKLAGLQLFMTLQRRYGYVVSKGFGTVRRRSLSL